MNANASYTCRHRQLITWLLIGLLGLNNVYAITKGPTEDSLWYYEIGGAEPVSVPANPSVVPVTLGGSAQLGAGYSCGKFDPMAAVTNTLNDIGAGIDNMMNAMTAAASAAIAALPALILQRANPGLYDMFQNALLQAKETMQLATKSCEQMEAEIAKGKNPYADLITLSKGNDWKLQMGIGGNDAVTAKDAVESSNGDSGIPYEQQARLATIADPRLRQEVSDFFSQCYIPARSKYQAERAATAAINALLTTYGSDDPDWMGSHVYRNTAGYYDTLRPTTQIAGWAFKAAIFVWTPPHFWALAIHRREEYAKVDIPMLPVTHGVNFTRLQVLLYTILLVAVTVMPFATGMSRFLYLLGALGLGAVFLYHAWALMRDVSDKQAMKTFGYSIVYLMALFAFLLVDHYVPNLMVR
jgi:hypothetical protein